MRPSSLFLACFPAESDMAGCRQVVLPTLTPWGGNRVAHQVSIVTNVRVSPCGFSDPLDKTIDHFLLAGLLEGDRELVAVDLHHLAVAEFLVKYAVVEREFRRGAGGFRDQLAFDGHGCALVAREAARSVA